MKRILRGSQPVYVERYRGVSLLCLAFGLLLTLPCMLIPVGLMEGMIMVFWQGPVLIVMAVVLLFKVRAFAVDHGRGQLVFVDRRLFRRAVRKEYPLGYLGVRLVPGPMIGDRLAFTQVFVVGPEPPILLLKDQRHDLCRDLAEQLANDLGCPVVGTRR